MSEREPAKKLGHLTVFLRPQNHVPVIGHQTISQQPDRRAAHRCDHNPLERGVIFGLVKKFIAPVGAVKSVVNYFTGSNACSSRHRATHTSISVTQPRKRFASLFLPLPRLSVVPSWLWKTDRAVKTRLWSRPETSTNHEHGFTIGSRRF